MAEDGVFAVQVWTRIKRDKESAHRHDRSTSVTNLVANWRRKQDFVLTAVRPLAAIGHASQAWRIHLSPVQVLVLEVAAVDAVAAGAVAFGDVAALNHEFVYNAVHGAKSVGERWLLAVA